MSAATPGSDISSAPVTERKTRWLSPIFVLAGFAVLMTGLVLGEGWALISIPGFGILASGLLLSRSRSVAAYLFVVLLASLWLLVVLFQLTVGSAGITAAFAEPLVALFVRAVVWLLLWSPWILWAFLRRRFSRLLDRIDARTQGLKP